MKNIKEAHKFSTNSTKMGNKVSQQFKKTNIKGLKVEETMENI